MNPFWAVVLAWLFALAILPLILGGNVHISWAAWLACASSESTNEASDQAVLITWPQWFSGLCNYCHTRGDKFTAGNSLEPSDENIWDNMNVIVLLQESREHANRLQNLCLWLLLAARETKALDDETISPSNLDSLAGSVIMVAEDRSLILTSPQRVLKFAYLRMQQSQSPLSTNWWSRCGDGKLLMSVQGSEYSKTCCRTSATRAIATDSVRDFHKP